MSDMDEQTIERIDLSRSQVFRLAEADAHKNSNGSQSWNVLHGQLPTGEQIALHVSLQPAGTLPNPAHQIEHSEIICLREGALDFWHDGTTEHAIAGDALLVAKGTMHGVRNVGAEAAAYFVLAIGGDVNQQKK
jgi:quercetin dioxygenase-like cupin family protein